MSELQDTARRLLDDGDGAGRDRLGGRPAAAPGRPSSPSAADADRLDLRHALRAQPGHLPEPAPRPGRRARQGRRRGQGLRRQGGRGPAARGAARARRRRAHRRALRRRGRRARAPEAAGAHAGDRRAALLRAATCASRRSVDVLVGEPQPEPPRHGRARRAHRRARRPEPRGALGLLDRASSARCTQCYACRQVCPLCCLRALHRREDAAAVDRDLAAPARQLRLAPDARPCTSPAAASAAASASAPARSASRWACSTASCSRSCDELYGYTVSRRPGGAGARSAPTPRRHAGVHQVSDAASHRTTPWRRSSTSWPRRPAGGRAGVGRRRRPRRRLPQARRARPSTARSRARPSSPWASGLPRLSLKQFFLPPTEALFSLAAARPARSSSSRRRPTFAAAGRARRAALRRRRPADRRQGHELGLRRRALERAPRGDHDLQPGLPGVEDDSCFCTRRGPRRRHDARAPDGLLTPVEGGYLVEAVTDKGAAFVAAHRALVRRPPAGAAGETLRAQAEDFRAAARERVAANLAARHGSRARLARPPLRRPLLADAWAPRCNGCGACASVCPTCHCFDIVDEPESVGRGVRRRNWDTCQTCVFTLHASGHNPRDDQNARFRQRIEHKFLVYPLKFGEVLCTGCGRCSRACPRGQDLAEILAPSTSGPRGGDAATRGAVRLPDVEPSVGQPSTSPTSSRSRPSSTRPPTRARCRLRFKDDDKAARLHLQGRPVRRVLGVRRRRVHLLHRQPADPRGLHRVHASRPPAR